MVAVAQELRVTADTVCKRRRHLLAERLACPTDEPRPDRPPTISVDQVEAVVVTTLEQLPKSATHWSRKSMAQHSGLSTDPLFVEKVYDVVGLYFNPPEGAVVLSVDEKSQIQALDRSQPVLPIMPGMPERRTHDYVRNGLTTLFAAFDVATGEVITALHRRHRAAEFKKFLIRIDKEVPRTPTDPPDRGQLRHPQDPCDQGLAGQAPTVRAALHPDWLLLDQPGRAVVRLPRPPDDPPRRTQEHPGPRSRHPSLRQRLEQRPQAIHLDQDSRRDSRLPRPLLPTDLRRRTLEPRRMLQRLQPRAPLLPLEGGGALRCQAPDCDVHRSTHGRVAGRTITSTLRQSSGSTSSPTTAVHSTTGPLPASPPAAGPRDPAGAELARCRSMFHVPLHCS